MGVSLIPIWKGLEEIGDNIKVLLIAGKKYQRQITFISHRQPSNEPLINVFFDAISKK